MHGEQSLISLGHTHDRVASDLVQGEAIDRDMNIRHPGLKIICKLVEERQTVVVYALIAAKLAVRIITRLLSIFVRVVPRFELCGRRWMRDYGCNAPYSA